MSKNFDRVSQVLVLILCFGIAFTYARIGQAQNAQFAGELQRNDQQLKSIEGLFAQIEAAKGDDARDKFADDLEHSVDAYVKAMSASFDAANKQAELAAKSQGKEGSDDLLKSFEDLAVKHEGRLKQLDSRGQKLQPKSGSIEKLENIGKLAFGWLTLGKIGDFLITPAEASIAGWVFTTCHQTPPSYANCVQAVASGGTQMASAHANFNSCWSSKEGTRPKWWRAMQRVGCTATLVAMLA